MPSGGDGDPDGLITDSDGATDAVVTETVSALELVTYALVPLGTMATLWGPSPTVMGVPLTVSVVTPAARAMPLASDIPLLSMLAIGARYEACTIFSIFSTPHKP